MLTGRQVTAWVLNSAGGWSGKLIGIASSLSDNPTEASAFSDSLGNGCGRLLGAFGYRLFDGRTNSRRDTCLDIDCLVEVKVSTGKTAAYASQKSLKLV